VPGLRPWDTFRAGPAPDEYDLVDQAHPRPTKYEERAGRARGGATSAGGRRGHPAAALAGRPKALRAGSATFHKDATVLET
jgi:hypothetical protein